MWRAKVKRGLLMVVGVGIGSNGAVVTLAPERIQPTYGISAQDLDVTVLLRHRGLLLSLVGLLLVVSGGRRELRSAAVPVAAASMAMFVFLALTSGSNTQQRNVAYGDLGLLALLSAAVAIPDHKQPST